MTSKSERLRAVKLLHTVVWVFFVLCIFGIPLFAWAGKYGRSFMLTGFVCVEILVLALNGWRCPLTPVAARYTDDRRPNFDIYLPAWLARYNKEIFGSLFVGGVILTLLFWLFGPG